MISPPTPSKAKPKISFSNFPNKLTECTIFEPYNLRLSIYENITCLENFYLKWIRVEPHAFLHAGFLSNLIIKNNLNSSPTISIGMNLIQESILVKNNNLLIDVYDIDKLIIEAATKATVRMKIENSIKYKFQNILVTEKLDKKYSLAILSQMDYIFDDEEIKKLALIFSESNIFKQIRRKSEILPVPG